MCRLPSSEVSGTDWSRSYLHWMQRGPRHLPCRHGTSGYDQWGHGGTPQPCRHVVCAGSASCTAELWRGMASPGSHQAEQKPGMRTSVSSKKRRTKASTSSSRQRLLARAAWHIDHHPVSCLQTCKVFHWLRGRTCEALPHADPKAAGTPASEWSARDERAVALVQLRWPQLPQLWQASGFTCLLRQLCHTGGWHAWRLR